MLSEGSLRRFSDPVNFRPMILKLLTKVSLSWPLLKDHPSGQGPYRRRRKSTSDQVLLERSANSARSAVAACPSGETQAASMVSRSDQKSSTMASQPGCSRVGSVATKFCV